MRTDDLLDRDALDQAARVHAGDVTPRELVEAAIARCEAINPHINAVTQSLYASARQEALAPAQGAFQGVPFLVKDFYCHVKDTVTTGSSQLLRENRMDHDSELMRRYRAAGLVTIGKTNVPEMASMGTTEPRMFGATKNPWNLAHTPGGSSGGAAAAVAAGIVAVAHANDGAGSTRIPAACCGLFGLKPSRGRITLGPDVGESIGGITAEHVVSRSVRDSAAMLDATQGGMAGDPYAAPPSPLGYLTATRAKPNPPAHRAGLGGHVGLPGRCRVPSGRGSRRRSLRIAGPPGGTGRAADRCGTLAHGGRGVLAHDPDTGHRGHGKKPTGRR